MKKILLALLASTAASGVAAAQSFPDVPAGSYAEEAVARLADLGIVIGFPDGTYRGNEPFNRYQAALVITRLLDTVEGEMLTDADLDTVRNALQELASDVAANEQSIADLQAAIATPGVDAAAVEQLQAQLDALTVELDTLNAAQGSLSELQQQVQANTDQIGQLNDLVQIINEDIAELATPGEVDTSFLEDIEQNTADIANLREFVVLLRRDQVGLTERVATIEESDAAQTGRLDDLTTRVEALEGAQVGFSGSIGLKYDVGRLSGASIPFDVDRIFGVGQDREQPPTYFSGDFQSATDDLNDDDDEEDAGEEAQDRQDIESQGGDFTPELTLSVDFSSTRGIAPESGLNTFEASVALELSEGTILDPDADVDGDDDGTPFDFTDPDNYFEGYVFEFNSFEATLGPIGADPINFYYGEDPGADFSEYVFESLGPGFRVEIGTPDFLAFLQPTLQLAYGTYENGGDADDDTLELPDNGDDTLAVGAPGSAPDADVTAPGATPVANPWTDAYYRGIRGTLTPFSGEGFGLTGGFSVGQISGNAAENADAADNNADITVYGLDGTLNLSIFNLTFEYATNDIGEGVYFQQNDNLLQNAAEETSDFAGTPIDEGDGIPVGVDGSDLDSTVYYGELTVDTEAAGIPLLRSLSANYRSVPEYWYGLKYDEDSYPWETDQVGYGAEATIGLSIFNLTGFYDTYTVTGDETEPGLTEGTTVTGNTVAAYGVELGAEIFRAVEVYGFYNIVTLNGTAIQQLEDIDRNNEYEAGLGVGVRHDGEAENALVPGLNFDVAYSITNSEFSAANLDSEFTIGGFTLSPYVDYSVDVSFEEDSDDVRATEAGTGITTEPLDIILQPSFAANVNYRNAVHTDVEDAADYTANVLQYSVGINFNQFLFENSTLGVRYGSFSGTNVEFDPNINGEDDNASDISDGDQAGTGTQVTNGYEIVWNYYGLEFGYGAYFSGNGADTAAPSATGGQAFSILYTVNF